VIPDGTRALDRSDFGLTTALQQLADRVAAEQKKEAALECVGFDKVPEQYPAASSRTSPSRRFATPSCTASKRRPTDWRPGSPAQGQVRLTFQALGDGGYKFLGRG